MIRVDDDVNFYGFLRRARKFEYQRGGRRECERRKTVECAQFVKILIRKVYGKNLKIMKT